MLKLTDINKKLGEFALSGINLLVPEGQYYVLLGRSGAGKTQLLELIAGLERPDSGSVLLDGEEITFRKIQERKIGIVFQDYAIFPHMTVFGNIAYPLRSRRIEEKIVGTKVSEAAKQMNISHLLHRTTENLSGGERQRIALARTLITSPRLLLLDEPLSSLDATLRDEMKRVLRRLNLGGQTIIHVTHDYADALSLASRVGVIHNGKIIQEGSVDEVFSKPINRFVARYAGIKNFFKLNIRVDGKRNRAVTSNGIEMIVPESDLSGDCLAVMRSKDIKLHSNKPSENGSNLFRGKVSDISRSEYGMELAVEAGDSFYTDISEQEYKMLGIQLGSEIWISFAPGSIILLDTSHSD